jgi:hypothetical protein
MVLAMAIIEGGYKRPGKDTILEHTESKTNVISAG